MEPERCVEHGLVADANQQCVLCRRKARVSTTRHVWFALAALLSCGIAAACAVWGFEEQHTRDRALQAALGPATAIHPWIDLPVHEQDTRLQRPDVAASMQGTRRFLFPPAESARAPASEPQGEAARDAGPDRNKRIREARETVSVKLYMADWCPACQEAKRWLREQGIRYEEQDIDTSESIRAELRRINPKRTIPTFNIEGLVLVGFSAGGVESAIRRASEAKGKRDDGH